MKPKQEASQLHAKLPYHSYQSTEMAPTLIRSLPTHPDAFGRNLTSNICIYVSFISLPVCVRVSLQILGVLVKISDMFLSRPAFQTTVQPGRTSEQVSFQTH